MSSDRATVATRRRLRSLWPIAGLIPLAVLTGCSAGPAPGPFMPTADDQAAPTPHWTDPPNRPGEITRSTVRHGTGFTAAVAGPLEAGPLELETRCDGASASSIQYTLESAGGTVYGPPGRIRCNGVADLSPFDGQEVPTGEDVQIELHPGTGVTSGYAILIRRPD